jgi:DNA-binding NarL/FixJ family response regulator
VHYASSLMSLMQPYISTPSRSLHSMIRLAIADDHVIVREGLKAVLNRAEDIIVVNEAADGFETISLVRQGGFDLLLLDLSMPGRSGIDLVRQIKQESPKLPVVVLTMHDEDQFAVRAIHAGARAYLTKTIDAAHLINVIRIVASGRPYFSPQVADLLAEEAMAPNEDLPHKQLTDREFEILGYLVAGKSIMEIAQELHLSAKTVSSHKARILNKLGMHSLAEMVQYAVVHRLVHQPGT